MAEFISKNRIFDLIHAVYSVHGFTSYEDYVGLLKDVETSTNADVQPVKRGRWICTEELYYNGMTKCSCCNEEYYTEDIQNLQGDLRTVNYCPNCGARMDGDTD